MKKGRQKELEKPAGTNIDLYLFKDYEDELDWLPHTTPIQQKDSLKQYWIDIMYEMEQLGINSIDGRNKNRRLYDFYSGKLELMAGLDAHMRKWSPYSFVRQDKQGVKHLDSDELLASIELTIKRWQEMSTKRNLRTHRVVPSLQIALLFVAQQIGADISKYKQYMPPKVSRKKYYPEFIRRWKIHISYEFPFKWNEIPPFESSCKI